MHWKSRNEAVSVTAEHQDYKLTALSTEIVKCDHKLRKIKPNVKIN